MERSPTFRIARSNVRMLTVLVLSFLFLSYFVLHSGWNTRDRARFDLSSQSKENDQLFNDDDIQQKSYSTVRTSATTNDISTRPTHGPTPSSSETDKHCTERFGHEYLRHFSMRATDYCDTDSTANLTCFSNKIHEKTDSFCVGVPAVWDVTSNFFHLDCVVRDWSKEDLEKNLPQFHQFPAYWYNTGPRAIFREHVKLNRNATAAAAEAIGFSFLVQREDNNQNLWHTIMEIMSLTMSVDVLRMANLEGDPFFRDGDEKVSQVIFLDDLPDGPYYDLWNIFAKKSPKRLQESALEDFAATHIVLPLPGSSNPFWQADWVDLHCGESELLHTFSRRVLDFYQISDNSQRSDERLTLTFIDRKQKRRLIDKEVYLEELRSRYRNINIQVVDFADLSLSEQIEIAHSTDILVGVHGAGLTHGMFLPSVSTIVEIQPPELHHKGFDFMAQSLGHRYFVRHGSKHDSPDNNGDWQHDDVYLDRNEFFELMAEAIPNTVT